MLIGVDPVLTGELLAHLDAMGHSDAVVVADAHFPVAKLACRAVNLPGLSAPRVLQAVRSVLPLDDVPAVDLMSAADGVHRPVQDELLAAAGIPVDQAKFLSRYDFYDAAGAAFLIIRTGEARSYGNAILRKGLVPVDAAGGQPG